MHLKKRKEIRKKGSAVRTSSTQTTQPKKGRKESNQMALLENQAFTRTNVNLVSRIERANGKDAAIRMVTGLVRNADGKVQAYSAYGKIADAILHEKTSLGSEMRILAIDSTVNYDTKAGEPATKHDLKIVKFWFVKRPVATEVAAA